MSISSLVEKLQGQVNALDIASQSNNLCSLISLFFLAEKLHWQVKILCNADKAIVDKVKLTVVVRPDLTWSVISVNVVTVNSFMLYTTRPGELGVCEVTIKLLLTRSGSRPYEVNVSSDAE